MHTDSVITLATAKTQIDTELARYSAQRMRDAERIGPSYVRLRESIDALVRVGGKRLRPYMVLATHQAYAPEDPSDDILPAAMAQELIHLAMLVHDDIIDRDLIRYGIPNVAGYYEKYYEAHIPRLAERRHAALSAALLAGDALLADAHQIIRESKQTSERVQRAADILSQSIFDVIGGELLDTEVGILPKDSIDPLAVAEHKTSSYSFVGPLTTGAVLAGAPEHDISLLRQLGKHLGIGYQLKDDLLGVFGDKQKTGKSTTTDITEGKRTFMVREFERIASEEQQADFFAIFHREDAGEREIAQVRLLLIESGAEQATIDAIQHHRSQSEQIITQLNIDEPHKEALRSLVELCMIRES